MYVLPLRLVQMYTNFNIILIFTWNRWAAYPLMQDFIRANSMLVFTTTLYYWITNQNRLLYKDLFITLPWQPQMFVPYTVPVFTMIDVATHLIPVLYVGLQQGAIPVFVAPIAIATWYLIVRQNNKVQKIYVPTLALREYDRSIAFGAFTSILIGLASSYSKHSM